MASQDMVRRTMMGSKQTGNSLRSFLSGSRMQGSDLSEFIDDAVKSVVFDQMLAEATEQFIDLPPVDLQALIDEATSSAGAETLSPARPIHS